MTDQVKVPISTDNAVLLLAAAHELGLEPSVVQTQGGAFLVPAEVEKKAFAPRKTEDSDEAPAKKTAAKKSTTKKPQE
jgi:hypothetical protein